MTEKKSNGRPADLPGRQARYTKPPQTAPSKPAHQQSAYTLPVRPTKNARILESRSVFPRQHWLKLSASPLVQFFNAVRNGDEGQQDASAPEADEHEAAPAAEDVQPIKALIAGNNLSAEHLNEHFYRLNEAYKARPHLFYRHAREDFGQSAFLASLFVDGAIVSGAHVHIVDDNTIEIAGVFCADEHTGNRFGTTVVTGLRIAAVQLLGATYSQLDVRIIDGTASKAAVRAYELAGFAIAGKERRTIDPNNPATRHLLQSADPDGSYGVLVMKAGPDTLPLCAQRLNEFRTEQKGLIV